MSKKIINKLILLSSLLLGLTANGINDVCNASIMGYTDPTNMDQTSPYSPYNPINQMDDQMKQIQQNNDNLNQHSKDNNKSEQNDNLNDEINSELNNLNIFKVINKFINNIKNLF